MYSKVLIIGPGFEQRISKMAYSFQAKGIPCDVIAEEAEVAEEFKNYVENIKFIRLPVNDLLKRTPFGKRRTIFLKKIIEGESLKEDKLLVIARDVNYGYIVTNIVKKIKNNNITVITDVADNYDLLYASFDNIFKKAIIFTGFSFLTRKAFSASDAIIIVSPVNEGRIRKHYKSMKKKKIFLLRNLPLKIKNIQIGGRIPNSFVYVGKIDEISRDPFYILEQLKSMPGYTLHFYSTQKESTIDKIITASNEYGISDRVIVHDRVPYDELPYEICKYEYGLVPHKRSPITDYTVPNKLYDYKNSGLVTIMSDCPSLIYENKVFGFGVVYSKKKGNFRDVVEKAKSYKLDDQKEIPCWDSEFDKMIKDLCDLEVKGASK